MSVVSCSGLGLAEGRLGVGRGGLTEGRAVGFGERCRIVGSGTGRGGVCCLRWEVVLRNNARIINLNKMKPSRLHGIVIIRAIRECFQVEVWLQAFLMPAPNCQR